MTATCVYLTWVRNTIVMVILQFFYIHTLIYTASDVTCSFPANGKFTDKQRIIYNAVYEANKSVFKAAKPGKIVATVST